MKIKSKIGFASLSFISLCLSIFAIQSNNNQINVLTNAYTNHDVDTYYNSIGQYDKGNDLTEALNALNNSKRLRLISYDSLSSYFTQTDPGRSSGQVTAFYSGTSARYNGNMNREHVWPFSKLYINTGNRGQNDIEKDLHMIRPAMIEENTDRGNSFFTMPDGQGWDPGSLGNESYRGDSARIIFYCCIADLNLTLVDRDYDSKDNHTMGKLSTLLEWNIKYPVLEREKVRNEAAESIQGHRNPFIDHPEYACRIWGDTNSATRNACRAYGTNGKLDIKDNNIASSSFQLEVDEVLNLSASVGNSASGAFTFAICNSNGNPTTSDKISISSSNNNVAITGLSKGKAYLKVTATDTLPNGTVENLWDIIEINVMPKVTLTAIQLLSFPDKTEYYTGEVFDSRGMRIQALYSDYSEEDVTDKVTYENVNLDIPGLNNVPVSYTYKNITKTINVQVVVLKREEPPEPTPTLNNGNSGCGGNVAATSAILSSLSLLSIVLMGVSLKKKRKQ